MIYILIKKFQTLIDSNFPLRFVIKIFWRYWDIYPVYTRCSAGVSLILRSSCTITGYAWDLHIPEKKYTRPLYDCDEIKITIWIHFPFARLHLRQCVQNLAFDFSAVFSPFSRVQMKQAYLQCTVLLNYVRLRPIQYLS